MARPRGRLCSGEEEDQQHRSSRRRQSCSLGQRTGAGAASDGVRRAKLSGRLITRRYHAARCVSGLAPAGAAVSRPWVHWAPRVARSWSCRLYEAKFDSKTKYLGRCRRSVRARDLAVLSCSAPACSLGGVISHATEAYCKAPSLQGCAELQAGARQENVLGLSRPWPPKTNTGCFLPCKCSPPRRRPVPGSSRLRAGCLRQPCVRAVG